MKLRTWWLIQRWRWHLWRRHDLKLSTRQTLHFVMWLSATAPEPEGSTVCDRMHHLANLRGAR